jgi:hypothetical protein
MTDQNRVPLDRTRPLDRVATTERLQMPTGAEPSAPSAASSAPGVGSAGPGSATSTEPAARPAQAGSKNRGLLKDLRTGPPQRAALVVLVGIAVLTLAFLIMIFVNVSNESVIALAVIATPIASMVAAYYAVTLSIQQVRTERADKERAMAKLEAVQENARETEIWASQMESGLRVAMSKLDGAGVSTDAVTRAAGTPDDFF